MTARPHLVTAIPGPRSLALGKRMAALESPAFDARRRAREGASGASFAPIVYASGEGATVTDVDGNRFVDLVAGFGALSLGYGHPALDGAREALVHAPLALGDVYAAEAKIALAEAIVGRFCAATGAEGARVLFGLSGADAVTAALKTAVLATGRPGVIAFDGGYHGLSHGPLAACGLSPAFREPFAAQLSPHVRFAPYPATAADEDRSLTAVEEALRGGAVGAILVEPILGRGGCVVPPDGFLAWLRALATTYGALLIADEIWTGCGRTGRGFFAAASARPDVVCLGKGLGGGLPVSVCVGTEDALAAWGGHGGTYIHTATHFGAPPACAAALGVLEVLDAQGLIRQNANKGEHLLRELANCRFVGSGAGLMVGVRLRDGATALAATRGLLARGYLALTGGVRGDVVTLSPSFLIDDAALTAFVATLDAVVSEDGRRPEGL